MSFNVQLRPISNTDLPFLYTLYATTREEELKLTHWNEAEKTAFLAMQFNAQHNYYQQVYTGEQFSVILSGEVSIGRLYIGRSEQEIRIIDIALLPPYRRLGIGSRILKDILAEARQCQKTVSLHVEKNNPALSLYFQLGFSIVEDKGVYHLLEWSMN